jgi:hypothetical protein
MVRGDTALTARLLKNGHAIESIRKTMVFAETRMGDAGVSKENDFLRAFCTRDL